MTDNIKVAFMGLGEVGETFISYFLEKIQADKKPIDIVAVADHHTDSPIAMGFAQNNVPVLKNGLELADLGDKVDIIFDLTGDTMARHNLRLKLLDNKNVHTVIVPEVMARLLWCFFDEDTDLPNIHSRSQAY